jgi:hypothetical protein
VTQISKILSNAWKQLTEQEREPWNRMAREDRMRYEHEKLFYMGPWKVVKQRKTKHADAPKRPMSAFLAFANARRGDVKRQLPEGAKSNGELSRALAVMWKEAPVDVKQAYIEDEKIKRCAYAAAMEKFRNTKREQYQQEQQNYEGQDSSFRLLATQVIDISTNEDHENMGRCAGEGQQPKQESPQQPPQQLHNQHNKQPVEEAKRHESTAHTNISTTLTSMMTSMQGVVDADSYLFQLSPQNSHDSDGDQEKKYLMESFFCECIVISFASAAISCLLALTHSLLDVSLWSLSALACLSRSGVLARGYSTSVDIVLSLIIMTFHSHQHCKESDLTSFH